MGRRGRSLLKDETLFFVTTTVVNFAKAFTSDKYCDILVENLNTATNDEILLIPGMGRRMLREFLEYRPYHSLDQFRKEISKYVDQKELARLEQYVFIPINLNKASDEDILPFPAWAKRWCMNSRSIGHTARSRNSGKKWENTCRRKKSPDSNDMSPSNERIKDSASR